MEIIKTFKNHIGSVSKSLSTIEKNRALIVLNKVIPLPQATCAPVLSSAEIEELQRERTRRRFLAPSFLYKDSDPSSQGEFARQDLFVPAVHASDDHKVANDLCKPFLLGSLILSS